MENAGLQRLKRTGCSCLGAQSFIFNKIKALKSLVTFRKIKFGQFYVVYISQHFRNNWPLCGMLFGEVMEPLGDPALLEEVYHCEWALRV